MIDITKKYTCNGHEVINIHIITHNSAGIAVTYPVKGSVIVRKKPLKLEYRIWSLEGISDIVWNKGHNLIEVKEAK